MGLARLASGNGVYPLSPNARQESKQARKQARDSCPWEKAGSEGGRTEGKPGRQTQPTCAQSCKRQESGGGRNNFRWQGPVAEPMIAQCRRPKRPVRRECGDFSAAAVGTEAKPTETAFLRLWPFNARTCTPVSLQSAERKTNPRSVGKQSGPCRYVIEAYRSCTFPAKGE